MGFTDMLLTSAAIIGAVTAIGGVALAIIKWFFRQEKQTDDISALRAQHNADISDIKEELCLLSYAMLACLDGLRQQGCNGEVTKAHNMLEKHLNKRAHH